MNYPYLNSSHKAQSFEEGVFSLCLCAPKDKKVYNVNIGTLIYIEKYYV